MDDVLLAEVLIGAESMEASRESPESRGPELESNDSEVHGEKVPDGWKDGVHVGAQRPPICELVRAGVRFGPDNDRVAAAAPLGGNMAILAMVGVVPVRRILPGTSAVRSAGEAVPCLKFGYGEIL